MKKSKKGTARAQHSFLRRHRLILLPVGLALGVFLVFLIPVLIWPQAKGVITQPKQLQEFVASYHAWALVTYVFLSILVVVAPPLPNEIVPIIGGVLFGFWEALLFGIIARLIGSSINYVLGTKIGTSLYLRWLDKEERDRLERYKAKLGWQTVIISRFLPSTDTDLIAYIAGFARMRYGTFILASFFGMLVPVSANIMLGTSIFTNKYLFFALVGFYVLGILLVPIVARRLMRKNKRKH